MLYEMLRATCSVTRPGCWLNAYSNKNLTERNISQGAPVPVGSQHFSRPFNLTRFWIKFTVTRRTHDPKISRLKRVVFQYWLTFRVWSLWLSWTGFLNWGRINTVEIQFQPKYSPTASMPPHDKSGHGLLDSPKADTRSRVAQAPLGIQLLTSIVSPSACILGINTFWNTGHRV